MNHPGDDPFSLPAPTREDLAAAARWSDQFEERLQRATAVSSVRERAREVLAKSPAGSFPGFSGLLAAVLQTEGPELSLVAASLGLPPSTLGDVVLGELGAIEVAPDPMVSLARTLGLSREEFFGLVERDLASGQRSLVEEGIEPYDEKELEYFRRDLVEAWEFAADRGPEEEG